MDSRKRAAAAYSALCAQPAAVRLITWILFLITLLGGCRYIFSGGTLILPDVQAEENTPDPLGTALEQAAQFTKSGDADGALNALNDALRTAEYPERVKLLQCRAILLSDSGDQERAERDLSEAQSLMQINQEKTDSADAVFTAGELCLVRIRSGAAEEGLAGLEAITEMTGEAHSAEERIRAAMLLTECYAAARKPAEAAESLLLAAELDGEKEETRTERMTKAAEYYAAARQPEKAAEIYKKLLDTATLTDEQTADLWMQYAISIAPGDQEGANRAVDCAKALTPDADTNAEFQFGRVEVYTAKGDGRGAASALRTGKSAYELANAEQKIRFALRLGEISELFGQSRQAEQWYEAALEAPADDLRAHQEAEHGLMRVCMRRDQVEAAEEHGKKALELTEQIAGSRDHTAVPVLADLVLVFMQRGDPEQAKTYSDEAVRLSADSAVPAEQTAAFLAAGRLQAYLGNTADALPLLKCAASLSEEVYGTKSLMYAKAQRRYAEVLFTEEQYAEAAAAFRAAEQSYQQFPGNNGAAEECGYMAANAEKAAGKSKQ